MRATCVARDATMTWRPYGALCRARSERRAGCMCMLCEGLGSGARVALTVPLRRPLPTAPLRQREEGALCRARSERQEGRLLVHVV